MADLPQRGARSQAGRRKKVALVRVIDAALPELLVRRARAAIARLGGERFRESYFTTFWLPRGAAPAHAVEEAVVSLRRLAGVRDDAGAEWWIGRTYTTRVPIGFHFDEDVKGRARRHPVVSSVFFFNAVRGGHLAVTDALPGREPQELEAVKPRRNRYAIFPGDLLHGVLDARGRTPSRPLPGPRGRLRITLVVNYWDSRPAKVPGWRGSGLYQALARGGRRR